MTLYIAMCQDRHCDADVKVFDTADKAIAYAKQFVQDNARHPDDIKETDVPGWIYHSFYSYEGDFVYVIQDVLNE